MKRFISLFAVASIVMLSGCLTTDGQNGSNIFSKQNIGMLLGGAGGGYLGSQIGGGKGKTIATVLGVLLGGYAGNQAGLSLDRADQLAATQNASYTLNNVPSGNTTVWQGRNPQQQTSGTFTPTRTYQQPSGQYCREYSQTITISGKTEQAYGTACRMSNGDWKIQNASHGARQGSYQPPPQYQYQQQRYQQRRFKSQWVPTQYRY